MNEISWRLTLEQHKARNSEMMLQLENNFCLSSSLETFRDLLKLLLEPFVT